MMHHEIPKVQSQVIKTWKNWWKIATPLYFGKTYVHYFDDEHTNGLDTSYLAYIFNEDGSVKIMEFNGMTVYTYDIPDDGSMSYKEGFITLTPPPEYGNPINFPISSDKKSIEFMNAGGSQILTFTLTEHICDHPNRTTEGTADHCPDCGKSACNHCNQTQDPHGNVKCPDCGDNWTVPV